jgi:hypothetical protein
MAGFRSERMNCMVQFADRRSDWGGSFSLKTLGVVAAVAIGVFLSYPAPAATSENANSPLGINLNFVSYYDPEQPFLNMFKTTGITQSTPTAWSTRTTGNNVETHEEQYLQLDSDGYPTSLKVGASDPNSQLFGQVCTLILNDLGNSNEGTGLPYRAGQYVILYDGNGTISVSDDGSMVSTSPGRDVFNVAHPSHNGVYICITSSTPGNYVRNIRVVKAEEESLLDAGQIYTPAFLGLLQNFRVIRAMQWLKMDENPGPTGNWAQRPLMSNAGWGSYLGVPVEAVVDLCNAVSADCWLNIPISADDNYINQMATLVHQQLGSTQKVYVELSNEVWNSGYPQYQYAINQGLAQWPSNTNAVLANRNWYGMRTAQMCDIWAQVWGSDDSRVHCVLGAQAAVTWTATDSLNCPLWTQAPCYKHHVTDVAIAPYFNFWSGVPSTWSSLDESTVLNDIFTQFSSGGVIPGAITGGALAQTSSWEAAYKTALAPYGLPFIAYEGGQSLVGMNNSALVSAYIAANRDPRMATAYTTALSNWKANGGETYVLFNDIYSPGTFGEWGALESFMDTVSPLSSAPPKWQAIQNFIKSNPCWWSGCTGTVDQVPQTPANFKASN